MGENVEKRRGEKCIEFWNIVGNGKFKTVRSVFIEELKNRLRIEREVKSRRVIDLSILSILRFMVLSRISLLLIHTLRVLSTITNEN